MSDFKDLAEIDCFCPCPDLYLVGTSARTNIPGNANIPENVCANVPANADACAPEAVSANANIHIPDSVCACAPDCVPNKAPAMLNYHKPQYQRLFKAARIMANRQNRPFLEVANAIRHIPRFSIDDELTHEDIPLSFRLLPKTERAFDAHLCFLRDFFSARALKAHRMTLSTRETSTPPRKG